MLRLHEVVQAIVPSLNEHDRERFKSGLERVFIDNYAAIPPQSIRRLLALREQGSLAWSHSVMITIWISAAIRPSSPRQKSYRFDVFIDARGQKPLRNKDIPFPTLRKQLAGTGDDVPDVGEDYTLLAPASLRGRIAFGAILADARSSVCSGFV